MKKMLLVLCALALMLIPMSSMAAMTSISDSEMEAVTGQMGINIGVIAEVDVAVTNLSYGDTDSGNIFVQSASAGTIPHTGGYINVGVGTINLRIGFRDVSSDTINSDSITNPLTIDVVTATAGGLADALGVGGKTIVRIGLPDLQVKATVGNINIGLNNTAGAPVATNSLGILTIGTLTLNTYSELQGSVGLHGMGTPCQLLIWAH